jgi:hypothetical protein
MVRLPSWLKFLYKDTQSGVDELKRLRKEAEKILDRGLMAQLSDDDEYWRRDYTQRKEGLTCGGILDGKDD